MKIKPEIVFGPENIRVIKDTGTFGGPNMWRVSIRRADGIWHNIQWVGRYDAQEIVGKQLTYYPEK